MNHRQILSGMGRLQNVWIEICEHNHVITLSIRDNGLGLLKDMATGNGMGFQSLQEMTKDVGGTYQIESKRNYGTTIILKIPFEGEKIND